MSFLKSYLALPPKTRMMIGIGVIAWSGVGLYLSDKAEKSLGFEATEEDKRKLKEALPKIRVVDKDD